MNVREVAERIWSKRTIHPDYEFDGPTGQCGVTSAWLQERLSEEGILTWYAEGLVIDGDSEVEEDGYGNLFPTGPVVSDHHCWLESPEIGVLDLTWDQFGDEPLSYIPWVMRTLAQVRLTEVWPRVEIFKQECVRKGL